MNTENEVYKFQGKEYPKFWGCPFERGMADSYYWRVRGPHWRRSTDSGLTYVRVERHDMTAEEIEAYQAGYDFQEYLGDKKEW